MLYKRFGWLSLKESDEVQVFCFLKDKNQTVEFTNEKTNLPSEYEIRNDTKPVRDCKNLESEEFCRIESQVVHRCTRNRFFTETIKVGYHTVSRQFYVPKR